MSSSFKMKSLLGEIALDGDVVDVSGGAIKFILYAGGVLVAIKGIEVLLDKKDAIIEIINNIKVKKPSEIHKEGNVKVIKFRRKNPIEVAST